MLTDPEKKKIYDQYGEEGLEGGPNGPGGPGVDPFGGMFGFSRGSGGERKRKAKNALHVLEVSLADIYKGCQKKMKITRDRICKDCDGKGGKGDSVTECTRCGGMGRVMQTLSRGFMITQSIVACDVCRGRGKIIKDKCKKCNGDTVNSEVKVQDVDVEKGTPDGHRYVFKGEADEFVSPECGLR